jgi:D-amino-acid dehydrogenase
VRYTQIVAARIRPHVWLAAMHGMLGIRMSTASGQLMADLITGRAPALSPPPYRAEQAA